MLMRPDEPRQPRLVTWDEVDQLIDGLVPRIQHLGPFGAMVMITRGGVIPGGLLAEALSIQHLLTASVDFRRHPPSRHDGLADIPAVP